MAYNLLKGKKGLIFGALNEQSIAWKVAERAVEEGAEIVLTNTAVSIRMGTIGRLAEKCNTIVVPADATSVEDLENLIDKTMEHFGGKLLESIARSFGYIYGREKHVRINTVSQSPTPTTAGSGVLGLGDLMEFAENMSPLGNASAEDCADYVLTLFSDLTRKVTMQNLYHDGGFSSMGMSRRAMKTYEKGLRFDDVHQNQYPFGDGEK